MTNDIFAAALGLTAPWYVRAVDFDAVRQQLTIAVDFQTGARFAFPGEVGEHPVHDTKLKRYRHLNFFQHECFLDVRVPRVSLPDGSVRLIEPDWSGKLEGFTLLFEAMILMLCQNLPFATVARMTKLSWYKVHSICTRYVERALESADFADVKAIAVDETSCRKGHDYVTLVADMARRRVIFVTEGKDAGTIAAFAEDLRKHNGDPKKVANVSMDMSPAFISGAAEHLPNARITFDKFHVIMHASKAIDEMRREEQKTDPALKGLRWNLLKDRSKLTIDQRCDLDNLVAQVATKRTARAWMYREDLREILDRKQPNVLAASLVQWCCRLHKTADIRRSYLAV